MRFFIAFLATAGISWTVTRYVRRFALQNGIVDIPDSARKIHPAPTPLLGGLAIFISFWTVLALCAAIGGYFPSRYIAPDFLWGIFIAGAILMVGGYLDDKYRFAPSRQIIFPICATLAVIAAGIGIMVVSNPFGEGVWELGALQWRIGALFGRSLYFVLLADVFTFVWLMGMMYTTKFLDGLDGLVSGMGTIGALVIFMLSLTDKTFQPDVALLAVLFAGACVGFVLWNIHPARIFLGEGGSVWIGFMLGILAIISGGKVATALLVMGIPVLDAGWVIVRRLVLERHSPTIGDNKHLHFRLLHAGFSQKKSVWLLWSLAALFGASSLFLQTRGKMYALAVLGIVMVSLAIWVSKKSKTRSLPQDA